MANAEIKIVLQNKMLIGYTELLMYIMENERIIIPEECQLIILDKIRILDITFNKLKEIK